MKRDLICIVCPMGCHLSLEEDPSHPKGFKVTGITCKRGEEYAIKEVTAPTRMLTSTVRIEEPSIREAFSRQERLAVPSTMTVQAPQWPFSQPFLAPTRPSSSRRKRRRDSEGSTSRTTFSPLTVRDSFVFSDKELSWNPRMETNSN